MSKLVVLIASAFVMLATASTVAARAPSTASRGAADKLVGEWSTGPIPIRKIRAGLVAAGYGNAKIAAFFELHGMINAFEFKIVFYREDGVPFYYRKGWDPSQGDEPNDADHGPYKLLPGRRFLSRGVSPPTDQNRELFAYSVTRKRLKLRLVRLEEPGFSEADLFIDTIWLRTLTRYPYKRIS